MKPIKIKRRQIIFASLILSFGAAVGIKYWFSYGEDKLANKDVLTSGNLGEAVYVNSSNVDQNSAISGIDVSKSEEIDTFFKETRLSRKDARDKLVEIASKDNDSDHLKEITKTIQQENNIENIVKIKVKSIVDCIAIIGKDGCNLIVHSKIKLPKEDIIKIKDAIKGQTNMNNNEIKIVEKN